MARIGESRAAAAGARSTWRLRRAAVTGLAAAFLGAGALTIAPWGSPSTATTVAPSVKPRLAYPRQTSPSQPPSAAAALDPAGFTDECELVSGISPEPQAAVAGTSSAT